MSENKYAHVLTMLNKAFNRQMVDFSAVFTVTTIMGRGTHDWSITSHRYVYVMQTDIDGNDFRFGFTYELDDVELKDPNGPYVIHQSMFDLSTCSTFDDWAASLEGMSGVTVDSEAAQADDFDVDPMEDDAAAAPLWRPMIGERVAWCTLSGSSVYGRVLSWNHESSVHMIVTSTQSSLYDVGETVDMPIDQLRAAAFPVICDDELCEMIRDYMLRMFKRYSETDCGKVLHLEIKAHGHPNSRNDLDIVMRATINYDDAKVNANTLHDALDVATQRYTEDRRRTIKSLPRY